MVEPISGVALATEFVVNADGYDPQDSPITYEFSFTKDGGGQVTTFPITAESSLEHMLGPGL